MSAYRECRWHEDCLGRCDDCDCLDGGQPSDDGPYKRFVTMGSVRYGMRIGAVSPPPPGAGPRYRSQCCWPTAAAAAASGPVSRIPLLAAAPINSFDIISCANRVRMTEDATSELPQQATVRDHVLYSTKCLLKSQLKRCALVRPHQIYARLCEHGDAATTAAATADEEVYILNNLDRLPRFRFGGNRASSGRAREYDKRTNDQKLKDLTDRLKRRPIPPPRTRHPARTSPQTSLVEENARTAPLRSASFSQVDYNQEDKKYVRRRNPLVGEINEETDRTFATLPRSKNPPRSTVPNSDIPNLNRDTYDYHLPEKDTTVTRAAAISTPVVRSNTISTSTRLETPEDLEKKRDKSRRRKGVYIAQWPHEYHSSENIIPQFVEEGDFAPCSDKKTNLDFSKLQVNESANWSSPQEEPLSPEECGGPPEWNRKPSQSPDDKLPRCGIHLLRSDSLSEGEPEIGRSQVASDVSDCESRPSVGHDGSNHSRRYPKKPLRGPYGQMLEAEMKKPEVGRKINSELKFLEDLSAPNDNNNKLKHSRSRSSCNSSFDASSCHNLPKQIIIIPPIAKRKVSADSLVVDNNDNKLVVNHQRTTSSPSKLEGFASGDVSGKLLEQLLRGSSETIATSDANLRQKNDTRTHVVVELYDNERTYVESLQILVTKYLEPLKSPDNSNLIDATLVDEIFYQIPFLLSHHQTFLEELKKRMEQWDVKQKIGDVFLEMFSKSSVIESYTNYVNNWKRARDIIKSTQQSKPAFARFLETTAREHKGKLALDSLLIKPIQKFPKYELLLQRLIKHTDVNHPDHSLLLAAQREVHDQLLKINCTEREALELEQLREIEGLIEGLIELVTADRQYIRHDSVTMTGGGGTRKERALFLFSDLLLVTSIKRKSGTIRRPTPGQQGSVTSTLEANKYKLLMKIALEDLEIAKAKDENTKQIMVEMDNLAEDVGVLNQLNELTWSLHCNHTQLDDLIRDMLTSLNKQLMEQQNSDSQLSCLDLTLNTSNGPETMSIVFAKPEKRASWEESFNEAKNKLAVMGDRKPSPELVAPVPIRKTRAGLQFTCAAPTLGDNGKDVWVCNSDGYVGQVCVLSFQPEPTVTSCNGVCNARILCIASVPGFSYSFARANNNRDESDDHKTIQFDSSSSSDEEDKSENEEQSQKNPDTPDTSSIDIDDIDSQQSTMWLGTEDGCIHIYNSSDNIRIKKNKIRLQIGSAILCIIYFDNRVFVSLANGEIMIYYRDSAGGWNVNSPTSVIVGSISTPVTKMLPNNEKLWCACGNTIKIFNTQSLQTERSFVVNNDSNKPVSCIALLGNGVWLTLQNSAIIKCFHSTTFDALCEVNVAPAVTKMLTGCDDIIRQHKAACLRVTSLLACKDLLWIGTSAGVLLVMPLPHVASTTTKLSNVPVVAGVSHGHTGHVRFLTSIEIGQGGGGGGGAEGQPHRNSYKPKQEQRNSSKLLVISGGDGYEDFVRSSHLSEVAGREDSTNHLLLWNVV